MTPAALLALALSLLRPSAEHPRAAIVAACEPRIAAIVATDATPEESITLVVIDSFESGCGLAPFAAPFGTSAMRARRHSTLPQIAAWALRVLRSAERVCGPRVSTQVRLAMFHGGYCHRDAWADREARVVARVMPR